jgi:hypothetical protein
MISDPDPTLGGYTAYGLPILSGLALPELWPRDVRGAADVRIRAGEVAPELSGCTARGGLFEVSPSRFLLRLDGIARYLVTGGDQIVIDPAPEADADSVRLFLLGSVFGALLHQRRLLPLHGSAIETPKGVVLFAGHSGTGKSSVAAAFYRRGYRVVADEICALDGNFVHSAAPRLLLWQDVVEELGLWSDAVRQVRPNLKKYNVPLGGGVLGDPLPVHAIYILNIANGPDLRISRLAGIEKLQALIQYTFRRQFLWEMESGTGYMDRAAAVARNIRISRLTRSPSRSLIETADLLEGDFSH